MTNFEETLIAAFRQPGASSHELRDPAGARLRRLREQGLVDAIGNSPKGWFPTAAGELLARRRMFERKRDEVRRRRLKALADRAIAEALFEFADALLIAQASPLLCSPRRRSLCFGELVCALKDTVGHRALVTTDVTGQQFAPITGVGTIDSCGEERDREDWLITLEVDGSAFVRFSRRHFVYAVEDSYVGELRVRQGADTTVVWLDID